MADETDREKLREEVEEKRRKAEDEKTRDIAEERRKMIAAGAAKGARAIGGFGKATAGAAIGGAAAVAGAAFAANRITLFFFLAVLNHLYQGYATNWQWNELTASMVIFDVVLAIFFLIFFIIRNPDNKPYITIFGLVILLEFFLPLFASQFSVLAANKFTAWIFFKPFTPWWIFASWAVGFASGKMSLLQAASIIAFVLIIGGAAAIAEFTEKVTSADNRDAYKEAVTKAGRFSEAKKNLQIWWDKRFCLSTAITPEQREECEKIGKEGVSGAQKEGVVPDSIALIQLPEAKRVFFPEQGFKANLRVFASNSDMNLAIGCSIKKDKTEIAGSIVGVESSLRVGKGSEIDKSILCVPSRTGKLSENVNVEFKINAAGSISSSLRNVFVGRERLESMTSSEVNSILNTYFAGSDFRSKSDIGLIQLNMKTEARPLIGAGNPVLLSLAVQNFGEGEVKSIDSAEVELPEGVALNSISRSIFEQSGNTLILRPEILYEKEISIAGSVPISIADALLDTGGLKLIGAAPEPREFTARMEYTYELKRGFVYEIPIKKEELEAAQAAARQAGAS